MAPTRGPFVRPLLAERRGALQQYLRDIGEPWRDDSTNEELTQPRNRLRHDVVPLLRRFFNPRVDVAIARAADILRADEALLAQLADEAATTIVARADGRAVIDARALAALPMALARRVARIALETANPLRSYGLEEADAVIDTAAGRATSNLPGVSCLRVGTTLVIARVSPEAPRHPEGGGADGEFSAVMTVPGAVADPTGGWAVAAEGPLPVPALVVTDADRVVVDAGAVSPPLRVRHRRPGDRLQPLGMTGHRKLQDVLVDRKVPRADRDNVPVVTDASGRIVWVAGHVMAEPFRVTARTSAVVILTLRRSRARRPS